MNLSPQHTYWAGLASALCKNSIGEQLCCYSNILLSMDMRKQTGRKKMCYFLVILSMDMYERTNGQEVSGAETIR